MVCVSTRFRSTVRPVPTLCQSSSHLTEKSTSQKYSELLQRTVYQTANLLTSLEHLANLSRIYGRNTRRSEASQVETTVLRVRSHTLDVGQTGNLSRWLDRRSSSVPSAATMRYCGDLRTRIHLTTILPWQHYGYSGSYPRNSRLSQTRNQL